MAPPFFVRLVTRAPALLGPAQEPDRVAHTSQDLGEAEAWLDERLLHERCDAEQATLQVLELAQTLAQRAPKLRRVAVLYREELGAAAQAAVAAWKCVAREWAQLHGHALLLRTIGVADGADAARARELCWSEGPEELMLTPQGVVTPVLAAGETMPASLDASGVWILTGGTRGIMGEIARQLIGLGARELVLVGRTPAASTSAPLSASDARAQAKASLPAGASPAEINAAAARLQREREVARTVDELSALGARVHVMSGDVSAPDTLERTREATRGATVAGVVWGAGIDQSRALLSKTADEARRVLAPKLAARAWWDAFAGAFPVAIGSVSGRFGNAGQIDYGAANAALVAEAIARGGLGLDYTAWAEVGMAASLARAMAERGVDALPARDTAALSARLILSRARGELVISGRLRGVEDLPLADEILVEIPGREILWRAELTLARAFLADHRPTSAGVLPAVVALGAMEAAARRLLPLSWRVESFEIASGFKVFEGRSNVAQVHAVLTEQGVRAEVRSAQGVHHRATFVVGGHDQLSAPLNGTNLRAGPASSELYRTFFHGPSFQVVERSELGDRCARAVSRPLTEPLARDLPEGCRPTVAARELVLQAAGVFLTESLRTLALPVGAERIEVRRPPRSDEVVEAHVQFREQRDDVFLFDAALLGEDHTCIERWDRVAFRRLGQLS